MPSKRGIVISPPFEVLPEGGIKFGGNISAFELRKYLLYWDEIDYPDNNIISIGTSPDIKFLIEAGVVIRTRQQLIGRFSLDNGEIFLSAQQAAFEKHQKENPGLWSLAQLSQIPHFPDSKLFPAIEFELWKCLPTPNLDVPLNEILEFKDKRSSELISLRVYMDEMYQNIISTADIPRAKDTAITKLEKALADVNQTLDEFGISKIISSLRGYISGDFINDASFGLSSMSITTQLPTIASFAIGASFSFLVKKLPSPRAQLNSHPLTYISSIHKEL
jgi:hypothetical protein